MKLLKGLILIFLLLVMITDLAGYEKKKMNILVYPFKNSGQKSYSWVSAGMTDAVIADLNKVNDLYVISPEDRKIAVKEISFGQSGMADEKTVTEIGKLTCANIIFTGNYFVHEKRIRIFAKLIDVLSGKVIHSAKIDGDVSHLMNLQDKVVSNLLNKTRSVKFSDVRSVDLNDSYSSVKRKLKKPSVKAYRFFSKGLELQNNDPQNAVGFFKKAVSESPSYLRAHVILINTYIDLGQFNKALNQVITAQGVISESGLTDSVYHADLIASAGTIYFQKGDFSTALDRYVESKKILDGLGEVETRIYAEILGSIGTVYHFKINYGVALEYYAKAERIAEYLQLTKTKFYASLLNNTGLAFNGQKKYERALAYCFRAQKIRKNLKLHNMLDYGRTMGNIGWIYYVNFNKPCDAVKYYQICVDIFLKHKHPKVPYYKKNLKSMIKDCRK